jgi:hypothetical protein
MTKRQPELGARETLRMRVGIDIPGIHGIDDERDGGAIADTDLQDGVNVRLLPSGVAVGRGGKSKAHSNAGDGCIVDIIDDEDPGPDNDNDSPHDPSDPDSPDTGMRFLYEKNGTDVKVVDSYDDVAVVKLNADINQTEGRTFAELEGYLITGSQDTSAPIYTINTKTGGQSQLFVMADTFLYDLLSIDDVLYLATDDTTDARVYSADIDSTEPTEIGNFTNGTPPRLGNLAGVLHYTNAHLFKKYVSNAWVAISLPGALTLFKCRKMVPFLGKLYLIGYDDIATDTARIVVYDGTTATIANSPAGRQCYSGVVHKDVLYYAWKTAGGAMWLGRYDGINWIDQYKELTAQFATVTAVYQMRSYRDDVYAGTNAGLYRSPGEDITGTWATIESVAVGDMFGIVG